VFIGSVTPPFKITLSPGWGFVAAQFAVHPFIPGACCQGLDFEVPLFESLPLE
jgi:hypothetical protein